MLLVLPINVEYEVYWGYIDEDSDSADDGKLEIRWDLWKLIENTFEDLVPKNIGDEYEAKDPKFNFGVWDDLREIDCDFYAFFEFSIPELRQEFEDLLNKLKDKIKNYTAKADVISYGDQIYGGYPSYDPPEYAESEGTYEGSLDIGDIIFIE